MKPIIGIVIFSIVMITSYFLLENLTSLHTAFTVIIAISVAFFSEWLYYRFLSK